MNHDQKVQQWYEDRASVLHALRVESQKRSDCNEWLPGEDPSKFVAEGLVAWAAEHPFPEA